MTTFARGESGKPSRLTTGLLDNSISFVKKGILGLCVLGLIGACRMTPEGRDFLQGTMYNAANTGISTYVGNKVDEQMYGQPSESSRHSSDRKVLFSGGEWTYIEDGTHYITKEENGNIFRMRNGNWVLVPDGTRIFYFK